MALVLTHYLCLAYGTWNEWMTESKEAVMSVLTPEALDARKWTHGFEVAPYHADTALHFKKISSCLSLCIWFKQRMVFSWFLGHISPSEFWRKMIGTNYSDVVISIRLSFVWLTVPLSLSMIWSSHYSAQRPSCEAPFVSSSSTCLCVSWHLC